MESIYRRNIQFKDEVDRLNKGKILGVAIDTSKTFHQVIIFDFKGRILSEEFSINTLKEGYQFLQQHIAEAAQKISAKRIYVAVEMPASYSDNLIRHLQKDFKNVVFMAPTMVAENRKQKSLAGLKTDSIDCGAIGDLLIRGEFSKSAVETGIFLKLKEAVYWREKKLYLLVAIKNQIAHRLEKVYPGLNIADANNERLYAKADESFLLKGLLQTRMTTQEVLKCPSKELTRLFQYDNRWIGEKKIRQLKLRLRKMLVPQEDIARINIHFLEKDYRLLRNIEKEILGVEDEIIRLGKQTYARFIMGQIRGVSDLYASMYAGLLGDIRRFKSPSHIFSKAGMCPGVHQSGSGRKYKGITRTGNAHLRSILFRMAGSVMLNEPLFKNYFKKIKRKRKKHWKVYRISIANKLNRILFALIRDKSLFAKEPLEPRIKT